MDYSNHSTSLAGTILYSLSLGRIGIATLNTTLSPFTASWAGPFSACNYLIFIPMTPVVGPVIMLLSPTVSLRDSIVNSATLSNAFALA
jgi:hypothetical protein